MIRTLRGQILFIIGYAALLGTGVAVSYLAYIDWLNAETLLAIIALLIGILGIMTTTHVYLASNYSTEDFRIVALVLSSQSKRQILKALLKYGPMYYSELSHKAGISTATVSLHSLELERELVLSIDLTRLSRRKRVEVVSIRKGFEALLKRIQPML